MPVQCAGSQQQSAPARRNAIISTDRAMHQRLLGSLANPTRAFLSCASALMQQHYMNLILAANGGELPQQHPPAPPPQQPAPTQQVPTQQALTQQGAAQQATNLEGMTQREMAQQGLVMMRQLTRRVALEAAGQVQAAPGNEALPGGRMALSVKTAWIASVCWHRLIQALHEPAVHQSLFHGCILEWQSDASSLHISGACHSRVVCLSISGTSFQLVPPLA